MSKLVAIVMAAGHGTRMKSTRPKVLHAACGRPLVYFPVNAALELGAERVIVVVNPQIEESVVEELSQHLPNDKFSTAIQLNPCGTGDAARSGLVGVELAKDDRVLILSGDVPLLRASDLGQLVTQLQPEALALRLMTFVADDPSGYGRVLRDSSGSIVEIREDRDLRSESERQVCEANAGVYAGLAGPLKEALAGLSSDNAQGEFYLTDIVAHIAKKHRVETVVAGQDILQGVNDRSQLTQIESILFARIRQRLGKAGVTVKGTPLIDDTVVVEQGVTIEDGVRLRGRSRIGHSTFVDVGTVVQDTQIGKHATVKPYCVLTESEVGDGAQVGPFAHLRPGSVLEAEVHIGNFVETKKTLVKKGAKANHLSYLGDAEVGEKSNIGAGTIICNYDGFRKSRTTIGAGVFVGSDSQLVAPLTIGDGAYVATATTVTENVPADGLAIGRVRQLNKEDYAGQLRARLRAAADRAKLEGAES